MATEKLIDKKSAWITAQRIYSDPVLLHVIKNTLDAVPAVDAVEVVRCKDCKHYWKNVNTPGFDGKCTTVGDDDFCSSGERKDNDDGNSQRNDL